MAVFHISMEHICIGQVCFKLLGSKQNSQQKLSTANFDLRIHKSLNYLYVLLKKALNTKF